MHSEFNTISLSINNNIATLQLRRGKANVINQQMVDEIRSTLREIEADETIKGLIITGHPGFFSAGLDVKELYRYNKDQIKTFIHDFGCMHHELLRFTKPMVCAINGHCPAGGTVIAITADHRIMVEGDHYTIGLNEVQVNIQITDILIKGYQYWIGRSKAYTYILEGKLFTPTEALSSGLINEIVAPEDLMDKAEKKMQQYFKSDPDIFKTTKRKIRQEWIDSIEDHDTTELEEALDIWWKPEVREKMGMFVAMLEARSKNKKVKEIYT